jgi:hypothetical protein
MRDEVPHSEQRKGYSGDRLGSFDKWNEFLLVIYIAYIISRQYTGLCTVWFGIWFMNLYYYMFGNYYFILLITVQYEELFSVIDLNP